MEEEFKQAGTESPLPPAAQKKSLRECVRNFTPAWFAVIMGTGGIGILFQNYPYATGSAPMKAFTFVFFFLNLALFVTFNAMTIARYAMFPDIWNVMLRHPILSLYLGCYPMGITTLINLAVGLPYLQYHFGGERFIYTLWAIWWFDVALSFVTAFAVVHVMKSRQNHELSRMTAGWLLPVVTLIVASSTGGVIAPALAEFSSYHTLITLTVSAIMVSIGLCLALMILTMYFLRLILYGVPESTSVVSVFIPLGPTGQAGYSILLIGQGFRRILPLAHHEGSTFLSGQQTGDTIHVMCTCVAFVLWALSTMWLLYAILAVQEVLRATGPFPFKITVWGLIFPNCVLSNLSIQLSHELDVTSFRIWGAIHAAVTLMLWIFVFTKSVLLLRGGRIFESLAIEEYDDLQAREKQMAFHSEGTVDGGRWPSPAYGNSTARDGLNGV